MFISDKIIFIELHKTGSSHIVKLLSTLLEGRQFGKHKAAEHQHFNDNRTFISSIRNPWDWYLSLWSYGCGEQGAFYESVTSSKPRLAGHGWNKNVRHALHSLANEPYRNPDEWRTCYQDVTDPTLFQRWLQMVHSKNYWADFGEGYSTSSIRSSAGLYTYRYLQLCCKNSERINKAERLTVDTLKSFDREHCYIDHFIHTENLEADFLEIIALCEVNITESEKAAIKSSGKTNASSRKADTAHYYNQEAINLVREREQLIIDKFGYEFEK